MRAAFILLLLLPVGSGGLAQSGRREQPYAPSAPTITSSPLALAIAGLDRDGDQVVSRAEYDDGVKRSFARGDSDHDGYIGLIEYSSWAEVVLGSANALPGPFNFDANGDDRISEAEFAAEFARRFTALDKNNDVRLARSELVTLVANPMGDRPSRDRRAYDEREGQRPR